MYAKLTGLVIGCAITIMSQAEVKETNLNPIPVAAIPLQELVYNENLQEGVESSQCVNDHTRDNSGSRSFYDSLYANRLSSLPTEIDLKYNKVVREYIDQYTKRGKKQISAWLGKSKYYFPLFEEALGKEDMPLELKYLPVIESALNPTARSGAGATGLWQFMHGTGSFYGLEINSLVDERRDPVKSTYAAVQFLKELYYVYQDWYLVIAAYNCGPANVNKAIYRSGGKTDYWAIYQYLPEETRNYVPAFIAATYVMSYYNEHDINSNESSYPPSMDSVKINKRLHFQHISKSLDIPLEEIRKYNPQYKKDIIPGGNKEYTLHLPTPKILAFVSDEAAVYSGRKINKEIDLAGVFVHQQKTEETLESRSEIGSLDNNGSLFEAQEVIIMYKVLQFDNLHSIAKKNNVTAAELRKWNNLKGNKLRAGSQLKIQKIEYVAIEPRLKEPEMLFISVDPYSKNNLIHDYLSQKEEENNSQKLLAQDKVSGDMKFFAIVNNIDYRVSRHNSSPPKKKNVLDQLFSVANSTYNSVKGWGEFQLSHLKTGKQPKEEFIAESVAMVIPVDESTVQVEQSLPLAEKNPANEIKSESYAYVSEEYNKDVELYRKAIFNNDNFKRVYHKVKIGETITRIATQYNVSKDDIILWNNLTTGVAKISQRLLIYLPNNDKLAGYPL